MRIEITYKMIKGVVDFLKGKKGKKTNDSEYSSSVDFQRRRFDGHRIGFRDALPSYEEERDRRRET